MKHYKKIELYKAEIIGYIKQNKGVETAELQKKFDISYKDAKSIIDELLFTGDLVYAGGLKYIYVGKNDTLQEENSSDSECYEGEAIQSIQGRNRQREDNKRAAERLFQLEMRRREALARMRAEMNDDDENAEDKLLASSIKEAFRNDEEINEDELRRQALELAIKQRTASVSLFQRKLPIGYIRASRLIDWMESEGYITKPDGPHARKVLITRKEFEEKFLSSDGEFESDNVEDDTEEQARVYGTFEEFLQEDDEEDEDFDEFDYRFKAQAQKLADTVKRIAAKKKKPISAYVMPTHSFWADEDKFIEVMDRLTGLIKSDKRMGQQGAVKKAETCLDAVRNTEDVKMIQVYERLVYELKNISPHLYRQLKKQIFDE